MIRLVLLLFVCLALPLNAATSGYVHLHTDGGHSDDHHDGREVHRHGKAIDTHHHDDAGPDDSHDTTSEVPDSESETVPVQAGAWRPALTAAADAIPTTVDATWLPVAAAECPVPVLSSWRTLSNNCDPLPDAPAQADPALRGPPR